jgi:hypothetical protein
MVKSRNIVPPGCGWNFIGERPNERSCGDWPGCLPEIEVARAGQGRMDFFGHNGFSGFVDAGNNDAMRLRHSPLLREQSLRW